MSPSARPLSVAGAVSAEMAGGLLLWQQHIPGRIKVRSAHAAQIGRSGAARVMKAKAPEVAEEGFRDH